jgi:hypothetical protein
MAKHKELPPLKAECTVRRVSFEEAENDPELRYMAHRQRAFWEWTFQCVAGDCDVRFVGGEA